MRFLIGKSSIRKNGLIAALVALALVMNSTDGFANDGMASNAVVHRAGLKVQWFTHSGATGRSRLIDWHLNINENKPSTFYTITAGKYKETFSQDKIGPFGKPLGADGAMQYADIRKDFLLAQLANDGRTDVEVKIGQYSLPETSIYLLTNTGTVKALDGDSGKTKWTTRIGSPSLPSIGIGSNEKFVAAVNGSTLYCMATESGKVLWSRRCRYAVGSSPAVSDTHIYVPLLNGRLESFSIKDEGINAKSYVARGEGTARPLVTERTISWPNSQGAMNVAAKYGESGLAYQLHSDGPIVCPVTFSEGTLFVASLDGFVYAINENRGTIVWEVSTGKSISESPIPMGDYVFVINTNNEMYKFNAKTGEEAPGWDEPRTGISKFVGAGKRNLYVLDPFGTLKVVSRDSGTTISSVGMCDVDSNLPNLQSDRLYVATERGMIQCLREISSNIPHFHSGEFATVSAPVERPKAGGAGSGKAKVDLSDPFGDPFGGAGSDADATGNPFGDTDDDKSDPFGGGSGDDEGDPFGGSSDAKSDDGDPFGG